MLTKKERNEETIKEIEKFVRHTATYLKTKDIDFTAKKYILLDLTDDEFIKLAKKQHNDEKIKNICIYYDEENIAYCIVITKKNNIEYKFDCEFEINEAKKIIKDLLKKYNVNVKVNIKMFTVKDICII